MSDATIRPPAAPIRVTAPMMATMATANEAAA